MTSKTRHSRPSSIYQLILSSPLNLNLIFLLPIVKMDRRLTDQLDRPPVNISCNGQLEMIQLGETDSENSHFSRKRNVLSPFPSFLPPSFSLIVIVNPNSHCFPLSFGGFNTGLVRRSNKDREYLSSLYQTLLHHSTE